MDVMALLGATDADTMEFIPAGIDSRATDIRNFFLRRCAYSEGTDREFDEIDLYSCVLGICTERHGLREIQSERQCPAGKNRPCS